jgi:hypothetical protein
MDVHRCDRCKSTPEETRSSLRTSFCGGPVWMCVAFRSFSSAFIESNEKPSVISLFTAASLMIFHFRCVIDDISFSLRRVANRRHSRDLINVIWKGDSSRSAHFVAHRFSDQSSLCAMRPETNASANYATHRGQTEIIHRSIRFLRGNGTIDECCG